MRRKIVANTIGIALAILLHSADALAFRVEESESRFYVTNGVAVLEMGDIYYTIAEIPTSAQQFEFLPTADTHPEFTNFTLGAPISKEEALAVIEQYYSHTAIDFSSIVVRDFRIAELGFAFWCSQTSLFGCLKREGRAGTWVEYEVNGGNKLGGKTGFSPSIRLIRKVVKKSTGMPPAIPQNPPKPF